MNLNNNKMEDTTTIRISRNAHDKLRLRSYKHNKPITEIIEELTKDFEKPSISERVNSMLAKKK